MEGDLEWLVGWTERLSARNHRYEIGLCIENIDNPGWMVSLDAVDAGLNPALVAQVDREEEGTSWLRVSADGRFIRVACGPAGLAPALRGMREAIEAYERENGHV